MKEKEFIPTYEELMLKENEVLEEVDIFISTHQKEGRHSPKKKFLKQIENVIAKLRENNIAYRKISKFIYDTYSVHISEQTILSFCKDNFDEQTHSYKQNKMSRHTLKSLEKKTARTLDVKAAKKEISNQQNSEDTL